MLKKFSGGKNDLHILLAKAGHKTSPDSRNREIEMIFDVRSSNAHCKGHGDRETLWTGSILESTTPGNLDEPLGPLLRQL